MPAISWEFASEALSRAALKSLKSTNQFELKCAAIRRFFWKEESPSFQKASCGLGVNRWVYCSWSSTLSSRIRRLAILYDRVISTRRILCPVGSAQWILQNSNNLKNLNWVNQIFVQINRMKSNEVERSRTKSTRFIVAFSRWSEQSLRSRRVRSAERLRGIRERKPFLSIGEKWISINSRMVWINLLLMPRASAYSTPSLEAVRVVCLPNRYKASLICLKLFEFVWLSRYQWILISTEFDGGNSRCLWLPLCSALSQTARRTSRSLCSHQAVN